MRPEVAFSEFQALVAELKERKNSENDVLAANIARQHFKEHLRTRRFDIEKWRPEFFAEAERIILREELRIKRNKQDP